MKNKDITEPVNEKLLEKLVREKELNTVNTRKNEDTFEIDDEEYTIIRSIN
ncbi:hypothetical protein [Legionella israelensis]|uniref:Uncharacterized protein n=1 Tax=Legionella israelensis TaxID=454 RepID=A0A0W0WS54_9GAMM|nr:hypothetical protein [Legionella israelensis]KTD35148.1 hypothetical protein Lisr_0040 [Legionella israelensis]SCY00992.1 hypothetical protein SAMN02746069_00978 [Legionella israelensis DSM 19235]STX58367.1 Uncharacterised protein [Legionella israelensis]